MPAMTTAAVRVRSGPSHVRCAGRARGRGGITAARRWSSVRVSTGIVPRRASRRAVAWSRGGGGSFVRLTNEAVFAGDGVKGLAEHGAAAVGARFDRADGNLQDRGGLVV